jgi:hypothetical protein
MACIFAGTQWLSIIFPRTRSEKYIAAQEVNPHIASRRAYEVAALATQFRSVRIAVHPPFQLMTTIDFVHKWVNDWFVEFLHDVVGDGPPNNSRCIPGFVQLVKYGFPGTPKTNDHRFVLALIIGDYIETLKLFLDVYLSSTFTGKAGASLGLGTKHTLT